MVSLVCLPFKYQSDDFQDQTVTASGWGSTAENENTVNKLRQVELPVYTTGECNTQMSMAPPLPETMTYTWKPGMGTCLGDSGRYYAIGVTVKENCGRNDVPGVYVRVNKYLDFISSIAGSELCRA